MPNKEFEMLGKEEIKEQATLKGMQNGELVKFHNSKLKFSKTEFRSQKQRWPLVKTDICFHSRV